MNQMKTSPESGINQEENNHPNGADLYAYFGRWSERKLSSQDSDRIALHIKECTDCFILGEIIQGDDETIDEEIADGKSLSTGGSIQELHFDLQRESTLVTTAQEILRQIDKGDDKTIDEEITKEQSLLAEDLVKEPRLDLLLESSLLKAARKLLAPTPEVPMKKLLSTERELPKGTKVTLYVFKALAVDDSKIRKIMADNCETKEITYDYYFIGDKASSQILKLHRCLSQNGKMDLTDRITFRAIVDLNTYGMKLFYNLLLVNFLVDGVWTYEYPNGKIEAYVICQFHRSTYGRKLEDDVFKLMYDFITKTPRSSLTIQEGSRKIDILRLG